jgi:RNA polymerase sigma factor (sigma-70 family)
MTTADVKVFVVDDDVSVRKSLSRLLESLGLKVETFASAREYLKQDPYDGSACLVLDVRMPEMSGLELQAELISAGLTIPIIFITGHGNVPMSVKAMKAGAVNFIEKPFEDQTLLDAINEAIERDRKSKLARAEINEIQKRIDSLTPREYEVFALVVQGLLNKQIASELGTSEKTVKIHRGRVMEKMQAESLADLVWMAEKTGIDKTRIPK